MKNSYMYLMLIVSVSLVVVISGCTSTPPGDGNGVNAGSFNLLISDTPANISDFDSLTVYFSSMRLFSEGSEGN
ncbi:MAG: hypothetical protein ACXABY_05515, partial [Candidatus Thorarchaeota archaeon]